MPRVQIYQGGNILPQGTTDARVRVANFDTGPAIAQGLRSVGDLGDRQVELNDIQDQAAVKDATSAVAQHYLEIAHTGPNAFLSKQGKEALDLRPTVEKSLDSMIDEKRKELKTEAQRRMFNQAITPQRQSWGAIIADHASTEIHQYDIDESASRVTLSGELARATYTADPQHGEAQITTGISEIDNLARLQGWGKEKHDLEVLKFTSGTYKDIASSLVGADPQNGPTLAEAFIKKHGGSMTGDDRRTVDTYAQTQRNSWEAEQRRIAAEARRLEHEQKSDARDRAQSVYRNIQDGVVVDPKELATAQDDAHFAGDPALVEGLRQGGLKNSLTQEWAHATPPELQNRINELSAQITNKGGKVPADVVVERDHLQTLLTNSNSQLNSDSLSWGAEHLGISIPPLNLNDQGSINARISAATMIAKRTGRAPQPLTPEEVAATQKTLTQGTVNDKVGLAVRLAKLGPLGPAAAQQLTNNPGFLNVVGLASNTNQAVAASRVNQVFAGYEALKTKPKLIDKTVAIQQFNEFTGNALQFLPSVKAGVLSNAQALLASDADEHGYSEWSDAQNRWYAVTNSALGAYMKDGKQIGGLHQFNGGVTVLPEDMSETEFDARIARSHGPEFRKAQNGDPVYANDQSPTATDLKRMQWVPIRDGVYRITDGHGFLHTKAGDFYEVDIRKLPSNLDTQLADHGYVRR